MQPTKKMPLFIITGASGVGKTTICEFLFKREEKYIVLESDLLWNEIYNTPQDNYREYRLLWLRMCKHVAQIGLPVVLCGCTTPEQFELLDERESFSKIFYLAVVTDENTLVSRMKEGRQITDENWLSSSISFNRWLTENAHLTSPKIQLLNYTGITIEEAAIIVDRWIGECLAL